MSSIPSVWIWLGIIACVVQSALFAGLTLAIFSLSQLRLQLEADAGNADAARVLELRKNSNQILATVMLGQCQHQRPADAVVGRRPCRAERFFLLGRRDHAALRNISAGVFFTQRFADDRTISAFLEFLSRGPLSPDQADRHGARLVAWH